MKALLRAWERGEEVIIETTSRQGELSTCDDLPGEAATREIEHSTTDTDEVGLRINENLSPENAAAAAQANSVDSTPAVMLTNIDHEETFTADNATTSETQHNIPAEQESVAVLQDNSLIRLNSENVENAEEMNAESASSNETEASDSASNSDIVISSTSDLRCITLPPLIRKRGRPKGSDLTVISLPKKRLKLKRRPVLFFS